MARQLTLTVDTSEVWAAYADRIYSGDKIVKTVLELLQNSVDAGATSIAFEWDNDSRRLSCTDDGCGFTEDTFVDKFLCLGRTTKTGDGEERTGGNGVAKAIILFNKRVVGWQVTSVRDGRKFVVTRANVLDGDDLVWSDAAVDAAGVRVDIDYTEVERNDCWSFVPYDARRALRYAKVDATITWNGVVVTRPEGKVNKDLMDAFGTGHETRQFDDGDSSMIWVLSNGLPQFSKYCGALTGAVSIDITPSLYTDFTTAREAFASEPLKAAWERFEAWLRLESQNPVTSARRKKVRVVQRRFEFGGRVGARPRFLAAALTKRVSVAAPVTSMNRLGAVLASEDAVALSAALQATMDAVVVPSDLVEPETARETFSVSKDERPEPKLEGGKREMAEAAAEQFFATTTSINEERRSNDCPFDDVTDYPVVFDDHDSGTAWNVTGRRSKVRKVIKAIDRALGFFWSAAAIDQITHIGLTRGGDEEASLSADGATQTIFIRYDTLPLSGGSDAIFHAVLYLLSHELGHLRFRGHDELFTCEQARLLNYVARERKAFKAAFKSFVAK